ncbi:hypothetical protein ACP4OV_005343 [Aristida adscensionis]
MDDEHLHRSSSVSLPSPPSFFPFTAGNPVLEIVSCEVPEQWLLGDDGGEDHGQEYCGDGGSGGMPGTRRRARGEPGSLDLRPSPTWRPSGSGGTSSTAASASSAQPCPPCPGWTGRRCSPTPPPTSPSCAAAWSGSRPKRGTPPSAAGDTAAPSGWFGGLEDKLEVRMVGREAAALRLTTTTAAAQHAPAHLMDALRSLNLPVQHASVCRVGGVTVQDAVVDVPAAVLRDEGCLLAALLQRLQARG